MSPVKIPGLRRRCLDEIVRDDMYVLYPKYGLWTRWIYSSAPFLGKLERESSLALLCWWRVCVVFGFSRSVIRTCGETDRYVCMVCV